MKQTSQVLNAKELYLHLPIQVHSFSWVWGSDSECVNMFLNSVKIMFKLISTELWMCLWLTFVIEQACYLCKKSFHIWRCLKCHLASHDKCAAFPEYVSHFSDRPWQKLCWKHDWPPLKVNFFIHQHGYDLLMNEKIGFFAYLSII